MKKTLLKQYARLVVRVGAAVQKGQDVWIKTNASQEAFAAMVVEECYKAGARSVHVDLRSEAVSRVQMRRCKTKVLCQVSPITIAEQKYMAEKLPCMIWLDADDPDGLKGVNPRKMAQVQMAIYGQIREYVEARENRQQWCIVGCASEPWAKKVFPNLSKKQAVEALWKAILQTARAYEGDPVENWENHNKDLKARCAHLNSLHLHKLIYKSERGTDFEVGLIPGVIFQGGAETTIQGNVFQPNIPSEECFTSPMKGEAEGIVYASKPLAYRGQLIENFWVRFHEGKAVEVGAEKGKEVLESILTLDEGAAYLGECALVPFHSPINDTGILFYNTLYDENAACHLALGRGFNELYPNFQDYSDEELVKRGINKSMSHVDFMIGDDTLDITGIDENGKEIPIFRKGNWAF